MDLREAVLFTKSLVRLCRTEYFLGDVAERKIDA